MWRFFSNEVSGVRVVGDKNVLRTWRLLQWFYVMFIWKTVVVLSVREVPEGGYRVGFRNAWGNQMLNETARTDSRFRMLIGHEDCVFFAVDRNGNEVALETIDRADRNDPTHKNVPLL